MPARARPTAVLTDDHPAVLATIGYLLERDFEIVATAADGMKALEAVTLFQPQLLVVDIAMAGLNGFETAQRAAQSSMTTKTLFLTIYEDFDYMAKARELGASYVFKRRMCSELLPAALKTVEGELFFSDLIKRSDSDR
jgi:YesN/AraC family two-component response regulator